MVHFRQKQSAASSASATRCKLLNATCLAMAVEEMSRSFLIGVLYDAMNDFCNLQRLEPCSFYGDRG